MTFSKPVHLGDYEYMIVVQTGTTHAHAVATNNKDEIEKKIGELQFLLRELSQKDEAKRNNRELPLEPFITADNNDEG